jgi:hypothetical protein
MDVVSHIDPRREGSICFLKMYQENDEAKKGLATASFKSTSAKELA